MVIKNQSPRIINNGTVGKSNNEELKTHFWNITATIGIRCDDEKGAKHLFDRMAYLALKRGIKFAYTIDEVIDKGEVKDDYVENIHRKLEIMREKKSLRNEFGG